MTLAFQTSDEDLVHVLLLAGLHVTTEPNGNFAVGNSAPRFAEMLDAVDNSAHRIERAALHGGDLVHEQTIYAHQEMVAVLAEAGFLSPEDRETVLKALGVVTPPASSFPVGTRVHWTDPDGGLCSGPGVVLSVDGAEDGQSPFDADEPWPNDDSIYFVRKDDGGEVEACPGELARLPALEQ